MIIFKFILFVIIIYFFGWQFLRKLLLQNKLYFLLPASLISGISLYCFFVNLFAHIFSFQISIKFTFVLFFILAVCFLFLKNKKQIECIDKKILFKLLLFSFLLALVYGIIIFSRSVYDYSVHNSYSQAIVGGEYPLRDPFNYAYSIQYHYGFHILPAAINVITGVSIWSSLALAMMLIIFPVFALVFALVFRMVGNYKTSFLAAWLFYFAGGLRYLGVLGDLDYSQVYLFDYIKQITSLFFGSVHFGPGYFHPYSIDTYGNLLYHTPTALAMPIILLIFWFIFYQEKENKALSNVFIGVLFAFLALVSEDRFIMLVPAWILWEVLLIWKNQAITKDLVLDKVKSLGLVIIVFSFFSIFQGGIITDMFANPFHLYDLKMVSSISTGEAISFRLIPGVISTSGFYPFDKIYSWIFLVTEWGIPILLFPFVVIYVVKKKREDYLLILLTIVTGFLISFFINYNAWAAVFYRFALTGYILLGILIAIFLADWVGENKKRKKILIGLVILMSFSPIMFNLREIPLKYNDKTLFKPPYNEIEYNVANEVKKIIPKNSVILSINHVLVAELWGINSYETDNKVWNYGNEPFIDSINVRNAQDLIKRDINYIYINPEYTEKFGDEFVEKNKNYLTLVYENDSGYYLYKINE